MEPYRLLSQRPCLAKDSILISPSSTAVSGLCRAVWNRRTFDAAVALCAVLAKSMPILLSIVPFQGTPTWTTHEVCTWLAVAILILMNLVLTWSLFIRWPRLPAEPDTIAGILCYICDSAMLRDFENMSTLSKKQRDRYVEKAAMKYRLGTLSGASGAKRIGIDYADQVYTA